jgi:hypothetical protein
MKLNKVHSHRNDRSVTTISCSNDDNSEQTPNYTVPATYTHLKEAKPWLQQ